MSHHIALILPNYFGQMAEVTTILSNNNINILGYSLSSEGRTGIVYLFCENHKKALSALTKRYQFYCSEKEILAICLPHQPGELSPILKLLAENKLNINVSYLTILPDLRVVGILEFDDPISTKQAARTLIEGGYTLLEEME